MSSEQGPGIHYLNSEEPKMFDSAVPIRKMATDVMSVDQGYCSIEYPRDLSLEEFEDFQYWLNGILKTARRRANHQPTTTPVEEKKVEFYRWECPVCRAEFSTAIRESPNCPCCGCETISKPWITLKQPTEDK